MTRPARRTAAWTGFGVGVALVLLLALLLVQRQAQAHRHAEWARALFEGEAFGALPPLRGRLVGHAMELPATATRCINCHAAAPSPASIAFATPLHAGTLLHALPRRGGPPSAYDASSLCRVLRDGIDPAFVVIDQAMPRYEASDAQCAALWTWLTRTPNG